MARPDGTESDTPGDAAANRAIDTLEQTARVFRSIAETTPSSGDARLADRLHQLATQAEQRVEQVRSHLPGQDAPAAPPARLTRVLVVDDHELAREALRSILSATQGFTVIGEAADGPTALRQARQLRPDLVLMDVRMPGMDGLAATRALLADSPETTVVILTSYEDRALVLEALRAGASGSLLKGASKQEVLAVLQATLAGEHRVQSSLAANLLAQDAQGTMPGGTPPLSRREVEVVRLMAAGQSNAHIARTLSISLNTVKSHVQHIVRKLQAADRASAVARAAGLGLLADGAPDLH